MSSNLTPSANIRTCNPRCLTETAELYDIAILNWSERQAELLRGVAAGERIDDRNLDRPNMTDAVESAGREQLHAVESLLTQALLHMLMTLDEVLSEV